MKARTQNASRLTLGLALLGTVAWLYAGNLTPPPGPITPTMKTLFEIEPRVAVQSLAQGQDAVRVITTPGSYYLTDHLTGIAGRHGIRIDADNVILDLGGFTVSGGEGTKTGILLGFNHRNVTVRNGIIADWGEDGVAVLDDLDTINPLFTDLVVTRNRIGVVLKGQQVTIRSCRVRENELDGLVVSKGVIESCTVIENGRVGIEADNTRLRDCLVRSNPKGIVVEGGILIDCTADRNGGHGIEASNSIIRDCTSSRNDGVGIRVSTGCQILRNECRFNDDVGILVVGEHNRIDGNSVLENGTGIGVVERRNLILRNTSTENRGDAYNIGDGNAFGPIVEARNDLSRLENAEHPWANFEY